MRRRFNLKKGLNLAIAGGLPHGISPALLVEPDKVAVTPDDFPGLKPKLDVAEGDLVAQGQALMHSKTCDGIKLTAPVSGRVTAVVRGARRKIERVVLEASGEAPAPVLFKADLHVKESVQSALLTSGLWAMLRQRPYDIVPDPAIAPRDIFVTAMDTAPLAPNPEDAVAGKTAELNAAAKALRLFTSGRIYIGVAAGSRLPDIDGCEMVEFNMLHPAGNAGIQAANLAPVNKGDVVWTLDIVTLCRIGTLLLTGKLDTSALVAVTGPEVESPHVVRTTYGARIFKLVNGNIRPDGVHHRIISGNILTGIPEGADGFIRFPYRQITVIREGDDRDEFMGWASVSPSKLSVSPSFPGKFLGKLFNPDARLNGGRRAMIMSGVYDRYIPMDILPEYLIKAIEARDIDQMEALGIYEIAPEDFALAEYADPSKLELQRIVRRGLDHMRSEV